MVLDNYTLNTVSSLIQLSVAPVFLLTGVAGLLNVFTGRLIRVINQVYKLDTYEEKHGITNKEILRRKFLTSRMKNINLAIFFATSTGLLVSLVIVTMFLSSLMAFNNSIVIATLFISAMLSLILSLLLFLREIYDTTSFISSIAKKV